MLAMSFFFCCKIFCIFAVRLGTFIKQIIKHNELFIKTSVDYFGFCCCNKFICTRAYLFDKRNGRRHPYCEGMGNYKVISSSKCGHMNFSHFYLVQDSTNTVSIEEVDVNLINDFVVKGDYVFFCGNTTRKSVQSGIFGYFNLNQFPNAPITYLRISECTTFSKIATNGYNSNSMRVFLTGK